MSVYFPHSKYADHHIEKMYKTNEKHMTNNKKCIPIIGGDFNAELGLGKGTECKSVGKYTPEKNTHVRRENKKQETNMNVEHKKKAKNTNIEKSELGKDIKISLSQQKKPPPKENEVHDTRNNAKDQMERKNAAAAAEAESTLVNAVAQETERRSMKRSSKAGNLRGSFAHLEHRRQDGWTSTHRGSDDEKKGSERDRIAGERLQNQRPHPLVRTEGEEDAHEIDTRNGCSGSCDLRAGERLPKQRPLGDEHPEHNFQKNILVRKFHIRSKRQVLSCSIPAEARACSRTTTKKHM